MDTELLDISKLTPELLRKAISRENFRMWMAQDEAAGSKGNSEFGKNLKALNKLFTTSYPVGDENSPATLVAGLAMAQHKAGKSEDDQEAMSALSVLFVAFTYLGYNLARLQLAETLSNAPKS